MKKRIVFKGWDWTELEQLKHVAGDKWPKTPKDLSTIDSRVPAEEDRIISYKIKTYLSDISYNDLRSKERKRVADYIRKFCVALSKNKYDPSKSVYAGLAKVKDDNTLIMWISVNLENIWN